MPSTWEDDIEQPPGTVLALKIIGWVDFAAGCLLLAIALITKDSKAPDITLTTGLIFFLQGLIFCTVFLALANIVTYLYDIREGLTSKKQ